jgi:hypothetical protein
MKHVIHRPRAAGKTTEMVRLVRETPGGVLVCHNAAYAKLVQEQFHMRPDQVTSYRQVDKLRGKKDVRLFVDNADIILKDVLGGMAVSGVSINQDCPRCDSREGWGGCHEKKA